MIGARGSKPLAGFQSWCAAFIAQVLFWRQSTECLLMAPALMSAVPAEWLKSRAQPLPTGHYLQEEAPDRDYDRSVKFFTA